jgi:APA family basic amino acid/polyamine antiporter
MLHPPSSGDTPEAAADTQLVARTENEARLRRDLGTTLAIAVTVNAMVGTGIFRLAPNVLRLVGGSGTLALCAWGAGGVISLCGALCMGELAAALPRAGGIYEYLRRAYGPAFAFWFGWTRLWLLGPSAAGSFARLAGESLSAALGFAPSPGRDAQLAILVLVVCTIANLTTVRRASLEQAVLSALKIAGLFALGAACIIGTRAPLEGVVQPSSLSTGSGAAMAALVSVMWSYDGWSDASTLAGEARNPGRTLPRAFLIGTAVVTLAYVLVNVGYLRILGEAGVASATTGADMVAMRAAQQVFGDAGRRILAALVFASCVGACMVGMLTGSRVFVSMASDGLFLRFLGHVSARNGTPGRAVIMTTVLGIAYLSFRSFEQLTDGFVAGMFPFYVLAVLAIPILRRREPELPRPFRAPLYPLVATVFVAGSGALLWGAFQQLTEVALIALGIMITGLPLGFAFSARARRILPLRQ